MSSAGGVRSLPSIANLFSAAFLETSVTFGFFEGAIGLLAPVRLLLAAKSLRSFFDVGVGGGLPSPPLLEAVLFQGFTDFPLCSVAG